MRARKRFIAVAGGGQAVVDTAQRQEVCRVSGGVSNHARARAAAVAAVLSDHPEEYEAHLAQELAP